MNKIKKSIYFVMTLTVLAVRAALGQGQDREIAIEVSYPLKTSSQLKARIDSTIASSVSRFNSENHVFKITTGRVDCQGTIKVDFDKAKLATKTQRNIAYLVNVIVPVYIPMHKINSTIALEGSAGSPSPTAVKCCAMVLLANIHKREDKLLEKYGDKLYEAFMQMNAEYEQNMSASVTLHKKAPM